MLERIRLKHPPAVLMLLFSQMFICSMLAMYLSGLSKDIGEERSVRVHEDINVAGISLGGLKEEEATEKLNQLVEKLNKTPLILTYGGRDYYLNKRDIEIKYDIPGTIREVTIVSQEMSGIMGIWKRWNGTLPSADLPLQVTFNRDRAASFIEELGRNINQPTRGVLGKVNGNRIILQPEQERIQIETDGTLDRLRKELQTFQHNYRTSIMVKKEPSKLGGEVIREIDTLFAEQKQTVNISTPDKLTNLKKAMQSLNGSVLLPGEKFSFNAKAGPFSFDNGYIPVKTGFREPDNPDGLAGGASQLASALYAAAVKSGLPVIERHAHLYVVDYAPPGLDAFVDGKEMDLRFVNNEKYPIYIHAEMKNNELRLALFGSKKAKKEVTLEVKEQKKLSPDTIVRSDPSLNTGQERIISQGTDGLRVKVYVTRKNAEGALKRELLSDDYYRPIPNIIASGPGKEGAVQSSGSAPDDSKGSSQSDIPTPSQSKETAESLAEKIKVQGNIIYLN